jgi:hypothetical protein
MLQFTTIKLIWAEEVYIMAEEKTGICAMVFSFFSEQGATSPTEGNKHVGGRV